MKKKIIPIVIAIVLIIIIGGVTFGSRILEKYSYSKERADLNAYYGITGSQEAAIVLQDEIVEEKIIEVNPDHPLFSMSLAKFMGYRDSIRYCYTPPKFENRVYRQNIDS